MDNGSFGGLPGVLKERLGTFSLLKQHLNTFWKDRNKTDQKIQSCEKILLAEKQCRQMTSQFSNRKQCFLK